MNPPIPSVEIMTDASLFGWSGVLLPHRVEGAWDQGVWHHSMNWKELKAIHLTLIHFSYHLSGKSVRVLSDNRTALACLRNHGSLASQALLDLSLKSLEFAAAKSILIVPSHIKGILNVLADKGSRSSPISTE